MIKIAKPITPPTLLTTRGVVETNVLITLFTLNPTALKNAEFLSAIYAHESVKDTLSKAQHGKCCFCESKIEHICYGDVEHFRPKKAYCQIENQQLCYPGYFWLAYEWANLFLSCQLCNQRFKRNFFPIASNSTRADPTVRDISCESPVFIDPANDDPTSLIGFRGDTPISINGNTRAEETIERLGLRREALRLRREEHLKQLKIIYIISLLDGCPCRDTARARIQMACSDSAEYSSAVRCAVADKFCWITLTS